MAQSSTSSAKKRRGPGKPFQKGQSGNPGGRPKLENAEELKAALKLHAPDAVRVLAEVMNDPEAAASARLAAANAILDRTFGKPTQVNDSRLTVGSDFDEWARIHLRGEDGGPARHDPETSGDAPSWQAQH